LIFGKFGRPQIYSRKWLIGSKLSYGSRLINYYSKVEFRAFKVVRGTKMWAVLIQMYPTPTLNTCAVSVGTTVYEL